MANEFICSYCGGDGTRCRCVQKNGGGSAFRSQEEIWKEDRKELEFEIERNKQEIIKNFNTKPPKAGMIMKKESIDIKRAVQPGNRVQLQYYRENQLWYSTDYQEIFPVPIEDTGNATFLVSDKAILFMRYMRKWNDKISKEL